MQWTISKKRIQIVAGFGATILIQKNHMSLENAWRIGMITIGERNRRKWIIEKNPRFENI
ncbi:hypothetical protein CXU10_07895 [Akkermansia muciniphila]|nr:hypothetical protein CXU10_07895 [Akkermansia muciniphila]